MTPGVENMMTIVTVSAACIAGVLLMVLVIHFGAKFVAGRMFAFEGVSPLQSKVLAVVVCPVLSYFLFMGVLWLSMAMLFYASKLLKLPPTSTVQMFCVPLYLIVPLVLATYALVKWITFQASRLNIRRFGVVVHSIVVALALIGTIAYVALMLEEHRRFVIEHMNNPAEQSAAPLPSAPRMGPSESAR